jgi:drug/metabolite transporter (DMT)-like permease
MPRSGPPSGILVLLYAGMILAWGLNFIFVKFGLAASPPLWLAAVRASVGSAGIIVILIAWPSAYRLTSRERRDALLLGIPTTGLFFGLWFSAAVQIPAGESAVLVYTFPMWVVVLSFILLRQKVRWIAWASVVAGFLGVVLIEQPWRGSSAGIPAGAIVELLVAAASWALGTVLLKARIRGPGLRTANGFQLLTGTGALIVGAIVFEPHPVIQVNSDFVLSIVWLGIVGTSLAYVVWFMLLERFPASTVSTWAFLTPVVALVASLLLFHESLDAFQLVGVAAILIGAFAIARSATPEPAPPAAVPTER